MYQCWEDLLFLHWEWEPEEIQRTLPKGLYVDDFEGKGYLGVVPFRMRGIRPRGLPAVPWISYFLELNVRTYVHDENGLPGVWFYSLDANRRLAVRLGRSRFALPYSLARMRCDGGLSQPPVRYECRRRGSGQTDGRFEYKPVGDGRHASPGTLEYFLVERYVLFSKREGCLYTGWVHHEPYSIHDATVDRWDPHVLELNGFGPIDRRPDHALVSAGVEVDVFAIERHSPARRS